MLTTSTPETVNPISDACEAAGVPCFSTVMPWEAWYFGRGAKPNEPSPFKWTYHFSFGVKNFLDCYVSQWSALPTNKKLGVLYPNDADGNAIREHLAPALAKAGYTVIDPGGYEDGTTDYAAQIAKFKAEKCEVLTRFPFRRTLPLSGGKPLSRATPRPSRSRRSRRQDCSPRKSKRSGRSGISLLELAIGIPTSRTAHR